MQASESNCQRFQLMPNRMMRINESPAACCLWIKTLLAMFHPNMPHSVVNPAETLSSSFIIITKAPGDTGDILQTRTGVDASKQAGKQVRKAGQV